MKRKKGRHKGLIRLFWGTLLVTVICGSLGWVYRSHWITGSIEIQLAQQGKIDHFVTVQAVFANEESVVKAPTAGQVEFLGNNGQRFRRGETIAQIHAPGGDAGIKSSPIAAYVSAPDGGLLFQTVDGLEGTLTPQSLCEMDLAKLLEQKGTPPSQNSSVQAGAPIGKMVNNLIPTVAFVELKPTADLKIGGTLSFDLGGETQKAKILRKSDQPQGMVVRFNQYLEGTTLQRIQNIHWISRPSASGVVIPKSALLTKGEEMGVYVVEEGIFQFRSVKVVDENESLVCVEDLPEGIPVVKNPRPGIEGLAAHVKIPS